MAGEAAVYVMWSYGIRSVIVRTSFGDIHYRRQITAERHAAGGITRRDLSRNCASSCARSPARRSRSISRNTQTVTGPDRATYRFEIDPNHKEPLLKGLDDIGLVMQTFKWSAFEKRNTTKRCRGSPDHHQR